MGSLSDKITAEKENIEKTLANLVAANKKNKKIYRLRINFNVKEV